MRLKTMDSFWFLTRWLGGQGSKDYLYIREGLVLTTLKERAGDKWACTVISSAIMKPADTLHDLTPAAGHIENADWFLARILQHNINMILETVTNGR